MTQQRAIAKTHEVPIPPPPQAHVEAQSASTVTAQTQDDETGSGDETRSNPWSNDDVDVESNAGEASVVESSWVNLQEKHD